MNRDLHLLIDYYNLPFTTRRRGIRYVIDCILHTIGPQGLTGTQHIHARLYAGWHKGATLTKAAQSLTAEVQHVFPAIVHVNDGQSSAVVNVNVTMAYSISAMPGRTLDYTLRTYPLEDALTCKHQGDLNCANLNCPMSTVFQFVNNNNCPESNCSLKVNDFLLVEKQKLVDTMLTSDAIFHSSKGSRICIVSSDDDFWPAILHSISLGSNVIHVHTQPSTRVSDQYSARLNAFYVRRML
jgi:hypothetical protein